MTRPNVTIGFRGGVPGPTTPPGPTEPLYDLYYLLSEGGDPVTYLSAGTDQALVWREVFETPLPPTPRPPEFYLATGAGGYLAPAEGQALVSRVVGGVELPVLPPKAILATPAQPLMAGPGEVLAWTE